jgi:hypothetical protein
MILQRSVQMALTPEEGVVLGHLADRPQEVTRFTPAATDRDAFRAFNVDVVWPLEQLRRRGLVSIRERVPANHQDAEHYWTAVAAELTSEGREAAAGHPRDSAGVPGIPEA